VYGHLFESGGQDAARRIEAWLSAPEVETREHAQALC